MIGNDIVCLGKELPAGRRVRYEQKIFCYREHYVLEKFVAGEKIALLWSIKESAFKCCNRYAQRGFVPKDFCVTSIFKSSAERNDIVFEGEENVEGTGFKGLEHFISVVGTPAGPIVAKSILRPDFVYTIAAANHEQIDSSFWGIKKNCETGYDSQNMLVRANVVKRLIKKKHIKPGDHCSFSKTGTVPFLHVNNHQHNLLISFSHDNKFVAYAYRFPNIKITAKDLNAHFYESNKRCSIL